jgi:hypothetical protein
MKMLLSLNKVNLVGEISKDIFTISIPDLQIIFSFLGPWDWSQIISVRKYVILRVIELKKFNTMHNLNGFIKVGDLTLVSNDLETQGSLKLDRDIACK